MESTSTTRDTARRLTMRLPDFVIIGAMKCATSTLHDQLARQPGFVMSDPKEIYFFSDDDVWAKGMEWYASHFASASPGDLCGESSTHYTKLPTYPDTVKRLRQCLPDTKLIYMMRHPMDRLVSHFMHEWSERTAPDDIEKAVQDCPRWVDYGRYAYQLGPFIEEYGWDRVLPVFFDRITSQPQAELERVCRFLGYSGAPQWHSGEGRRNVSNARLRKSPLRDAMVWNPAVTWVRRRFIPQSWRDRVKGVWQMKGRPEVGASMRSDLEAIFDEDLKTLGEWLGVELSCANFKSVTASGPLEFTPRTEEVRA